MQTSQRGAGNAPAVIALADAVTTLTDRLADLAEARRVLIERAGIGDLLAIAARARGPFDGELIDAHDWPIPPEVWAALGDQGDAEWRRGDLTVEPDYDPHAELSGLDKPLKLIDIRIDADSLKRVADTLPVEWVNAHDAIDLLLPAFGSGQGAAAASALAKRAHGGLVKTRARLFKWEAPVAGTGRRGEREAQFAELPTKFWWAGGGQGLTQNWVTGDFSTWLDRTDHLQAFGVEFCRADVLAMLPLRAGGDSPAPMPKPSNGGRRPANWWPGCAEELAIYVHEHGMPDTQETLITGVQTAMTERGKPEASRSQIQPVIRELFARLGQAGN